MQIEIGELAIIIRSQFQQNVGKSVRVTDFDEDAVYCYEVESCGGNLVADDESGNMYCDKGPCWVKWGDIVPIDDSRLADIEQEIYDWQQSYGECE